MQNRVFRAVANQSLGASLRIRRRDRKPLLLTVAGLVTAIALAPSFVRNAAILDSRDAAARVLNEETELLKIKQDALADRAEIANKRLTAGCNVIPNVEGKDGRIASMSAGYKLINPDNGAPFPPGTVACDVYGGTAIVGENGILGDIAVTTKTELVSQALAKNGLKMKAGDPNVSAAQGSQIGGRNEQ